MFCYASYFLIRNEHLCLGSLTCGKNGFSSITAEDLDSFIVLVLLCCQYQLHRAEHRLTDMEKPRSDDVLWNLPDYLFSLIEDDHSLSASYSQVL